MSNFNEDNMKLYAQFSSMAYKQRGRSRQRFLEKQGLDKQGWVIDTELSDRDNVILVNENTGEVHMAVRGSDFKSWEKTPEDVGNDVLIGFGLEKGGSRFKKSDRKLNQVMGKYGKDDITLSGHSLGGAVSKDLSLKYGLESHNYNTGSSPIHVIGAVKNPLLLPPKHKETLEKQHDYYSSSVDNIDPLSISGVLNPYSNSHFIRPTHSNQHSINNFYNDFTIGRGTLRDMEHLGSHFNREVQPPVQPKPAPISTRIGDVQMEGVSQVKTS